MSQSEMILLLISLFATISFTFNWYKTILRTWPYNHALFTRIILSLLLPLLSQIILYVLKNDASYDVVDNPIYIYLYLFLGFTNIYLINIVTQRYFDISWQDDLINLNNKALLFPYISLLLGTTIIYSYANIGDGPGFWAVIFPVLLADTTWLILLKITNKKFKLSEEISIDRDIPTGLRLGGYMLGTSLIIGKASSGDWSSFTETIIEFLQAWPVIILFAIYYYIEHSYYPNTNKNTITNVIISIIIAIAFIICGLAIQLIINT